jgi:hypothetical protein
MTVNAAVGIGPAYDVDRLLTDILGIGELNTPDLAAPVLAPLTAGVENATIGLLVTCGAYYPDQEPMKETNDLSYRLLPRERDLSSVLFGHKTPVRAFAQADPNVAYPRVRMIELESAGVIGRYAGNAVSIVGSISDYDGLASVTAPRAVAEFREMRVDLALIVPFCPQCHVASAVLGPGDRGTRAAHDQRHHAHQTGSRDETAARDIPGFPPGLSDRPPGATRTTARNPPRGA